MGRMNNNVPFEHQMMFIIKDYDRKVEEIHELRKELDELATALEQFGGKGERASIKTNCSNLKLKNKSLEKKLKEKNESLMQERKANAKLHKRINILLSTLGTARTILYDLTSKVEVEPLRKLANSITNVMETNNNVKVD